jgi:exonuclease SbcC
MRPRRLVLQNFTSYRGLVEVDFSDLDLFAITGPNGAGKSSLVEAMVYALYGRAPRVDDEVRQLISQGTDWLRVELEFECGGRVFRVTRSTGRRAIIQLEELTSEGIWEPKADRVKEAELIVQQVIGLDYDAFVRSIFLPQGRFQELLVGDPQKRNRLLDELLRLDIYKEVMRRANELARRSREQAEGLARRLSAELAEATLENLQKLRERRLALAQERARVGRWEEHLQQARGLAIRLEEKGHLRGSALSRLEELDREVAQVSDRLSWQEARQKELQGALTHLRQELASLHVDQERYDLVRDALSHASRALEALQRWQHLASQLNDLESEIAAMRQRAQEAQAQLARAEEAHKAAAQEMERVQAELQEAVSRLQAVAPLVEELRRKEGELASLEGEVRVREKALRDAQAHRDASFAQLEKAQRALQQAAAAWEDAQRVHAAAVLRQDLKEGQACPVCGQLVHRLPALGHPPDLDRTRRRWQEAQEEERKANDALRDADSRLADARRAYNEGRFRLQALGQEVDQLRRRLQETIGEGLSPQEALAALERAAHHAQRRLERAKEDLEMASHALHVAQEKERQAQIQAARLEEQAQALRREMAEAQGTYEIYSASLSRLLQQRWPLSIGPEELAQEAASKGHPMEAVVIPWLQKELEALRGAIRRRQELSQQEQRLAQEAEAIEREVAAARSDLVQLTAEASQLQRQAQEAERDCQLLWKELEALAQKADWEPLQAALSQGNGISRAIEKLAHDLRQQADELERERATVDAKLREMEKGLELARSLRKEMETLENKARLAEGLGLLLRSDRFQQFLREEAMRILAEDASRYLYDLTRGRYTLSVQGKGFYVADHWLGGLERPAHLLSGAETFLASLCLALALANRVPQLAYGERRPLESLFIDEGFGTLDEDNLDMVSAALEGLCGQGRMVGIITHIAALADRMPARLRVERTENGSRVVKDY